MSKENSSRMWITLGAGCLMIAGLLLSLTLLGSPASPPPPATTAVLPTPSPTEKPHTPEPSPTSDDAADNADDPIAASVNGHPIQYSFWLDAILLDQVASALAARPAPTPDETLRRMISEELVLQAAPPEQMPPAEQVEEYIAMLKQAWGVDDAALVALLEAVGLNHPALERAIQRGLTVNTSVEILRNEGHDITTWINEQRDTADVLIFEDVAAPDISEVQALIAAHLASPAPPPATETPSPNLTIPEIAPDFTLEQSGGGTFTLAEQLDKGPVVLVFFQKCG